jgi:hypothetical protein
VREKIGDILRPLATDHDSDALLGESFAEGEFTIGDFRALYWLVSTVSGSLDFARLKAEEHPKKAKGLKLVKPRGAAAKRGAA